MKRSICVLLALAMIIGLPAVAAPAAVKYDAQCKVEDFAFLGLTAEKADGALTFVLSYKSGIQRMLSVFDPPQGKVIMKQFTLPAAGEGGTFTFRLDEADLAKVDHITLKVFGNQDEAANNLILLSFAVDGTIADRSLAAKGVVIGKARLSESGSYMLPVRALFEAQGAEVTWDGDKKTVTIAYGGETSIIFTVGSSIAESPSGQTIDMGVPAFNDKGTVYICGDMLLGSNLSVDPETLDICFTATANTAEVYEPTPEAFVSNLTEKGTGLARKIAAAEVVMNKPIALSARSSYPRWIWTDTGEADIRWLDAKTNLTAQEQAVLAGCAPNITFNTDTVFPEGMPKDYDPAAILEAGKDPGLGVRKLHEKGVTGKGVGIAIIDQTLYTDHPEYKDKLALYEEIHVMPGERASMHGSAVASIAVGKSTGVAPGAKLYYWAVNLMRSTEGRNSYDANIAFGEGLAVAVDRVIEVNAALPANEKIRVISISRGFSDLKNEGVQSFLAAVKRAEKAGIFVITTSTSSSYDWLNNADDLAGLGKLDFAGDANDLDNYTLGTWQQQNAAAFASKLLVPMDARTVADFSTGDGYVFYADGGWSWAVPYLAGVYALACEADPDITPEQFWTLALQTASSTTVQIQSAADVAYGREGAEYTLEHIINPSALVEALKTK